MLLGVGCLGFVFAVWVVVLFDCFVVGCDFGFRPVVWNLHFGVLTVWVGGFVCLFWFISLWADWLVFAGLVVDLL